MNSLGTIFKVTSFGESHSALVGCVVEGVPAGLVLDLDKIQLAVDKRKTNQTNFTKGAYHKLRNTIRGERCYTRM